MTDKAQFEAMLEALINEDQETAKEIFHNIVVAKSREIYEELLESDFGSEEEEEGDEEEGDEEAGDDEESGDDDFGGDPADDFIDDVEDSDDEESDDIGGEEEELEDRVMDLEDALEELKAEFEQLMTQEGDMDSGMDMGMEKGMGEMDMEMDSGMAGMDDEQGLPEVVHHVHHGVFEGTTLEKVAPAKMGDNGANTKSPVGPGANMGGSTANIAKGGTSTTGGTQGGLASPKPQDMNTGNINVVGGNAGKTAFKKKEPGHGAEKKGTGEGGLVGAGTGEKNTGTVDKGSVIGKKVR